MIEAERAITRVLNRYAQGVDRRIFEQIEDCYWPDGYDEHGGFSGTVPDYISWLRQVLPNVSVSSHQWTNVTIDADLGTGAAATEAYCLNVNVMATDPPQHMTSLLRYLDRWERRHGEWRIVHRKVVKDWTRLESVGGSSG